MAHVEENGEETPASLERQKEKLVRAEELLKEAHVFTTTMAGLKPEHAERDMAEVGAKKIEVMGTIRKQLDALSLLATPAPVGAGTSAPGRDASYMYERRKLPSLEEPGEIIHHLGENGRPTSLASSRLSMS